MSRGRRPRTGGRWGDRPASGEGGAEGSLCSVGVPIMVAQRWGREREAGRQLQRGDTRHPQRPRRACVGHRCGSQLTRRRAGHGQTRSPPGVPRPGWHSQLFRVGPRPSHPSPARWVSGWGPCAWLPLPWRGPRACAGCLPRAANSLSHRSLPPICMWLLCLAARWS